MATTRTTVHPSAKGTRNGHPGINGNAESGLRGFGNQIGSNKEMIERLNADLLHARNENNQLVEALRSLHSQFNSLQMHTEKQTELLLCGGEELREAKQQLVQMQRELEQTKKGYERMREQGAAQEDARHSEDLSEIEKSNAALRARLQELEAHIDGQTGQWAKSDRKLKDYHDALAGMEQEINDWKEAAEQQERDNAELALKIVSLERRCAELDGRRAERESAYEELRATFSNRTSEVEKLNENVIRMQQEIAKLSAGADDGYAGPALSVNGIAPALHDIAASSNGGARKSNSTDGGGPRPWWFTDDDKSSPRPSADSATRECVSTKADENRTAQARFIVMPIGRKETETHYPIDKRVVTIGRSRDNDIPVNSACVSRVHARIIQTASGPVIEDMGSKNGVLVNSKRRRRHKLKHGDTFTIGFREFEVFDAGDGKSAQTAPPAA